MKTICLYFEIHQIIHLKRYRFFDIGRDHYYYDDYENERSITDIAERSYVPALRTLIDMAKENGKFFKLAVSLSGVGLEQLGKGEWQILQAGCIALWCRFGAIGSACTTGYRLAAGTESNRLC